MATEQELLYRYDKLRLQDANEAETRLKLVDEIIFKILSWTHDDVSVEERVSEDGETAFTDYTIRTAGTSFVVEAKRVGSTFGGIPNVRRQRLDQNFVSGELGTAIRQARDYARKLSIPFAAITNGGEWLVFPATRIDGVSFAKSSAIVFPSLNSVLGQDAEEFKSLLSRDAVASGSLSIALLGRNEDQIQERRLGNRFSSRGASIRPDPLFPLIESAVVTALTDSIVDKDPELLEKCYVNTAERRRFDQQIGMHLSKRAALFSQRPNRPLARRDRNLLKETIATAAQRARPIALLVIGSVGAGKTTFLEFTRRVTSAAYFEVSKAEAYPHWIYVDFRGYSESQPPSEFIYDCIDDYMAQDWFFSNYEQCVRPAYINQIRAMREGPLKLIADKEELISEKIAIFLLEQVGTRQNADRLLSYAASKVPVFLVVDNVDQFEKDELQSSIFSDAIAIAHRNHLNLVLCLRDSTFVRQKESSTFNAFDFNTIQIDPPPIPAVLSKRFFLMQHLLEGESGSFVSEGGAKFDVENLAVVAKLVSSSVLGTNIGNVIDVLSTSDVRLALRMTREFLESGYSNPAKAISTYQVKGRYVLPPHEALRSVLLGRQPVYSEQYSVIGNPFDARLGRTNDQLLRLFTLAALVTMSSHAEFQYASGEMIRENLNKLGFGNDTVLRVLTDLCQLRFAQTAAHGAASFRAQYYPTRLGGYIVRYLIADLTFLEATIMDTFIAKRDVWDTLQDLSEQIDSQRGNLVRRLELRHTRLGIFYDYMKELYRPLLEEAGLRSLTNDWLSNPLTEMEDRFESYKKKAMQSAKRLYGD